MQACLQAMPRCSLSYVKIMQIESKDASLLASYAEMQLILCANICNFIVWRKNSALGFVLLTNCLDLSRFFYSCITILIFWNRKTFDLFCNVCDFS